MKKVVAGHGWLRSYGQIYDLTDDIVDADDFSQLDDNETRDMLSLIPNDRPKLDSPVVIIVPIMDRSIQLRRFLEHLCEFWASQRAPLNIVAVEQRANMSFSRSWLFNVGFHYTTLMNISAQCIALHDVDHLPMPGVVYDNCTVPIHLSSESEQFDWGVPYNSFSGGVFLASPHDWKQINGMSNEFRGWGGEDDELFYRFRRAGLTDGPLRPFRPMRDMGKFRENTLNHMRKQRIPSEYNANVNLLNEMASGSKDPSLDGLAQTRYSVLDTQELTVANCTQIHAINLAVI